MGKQKVVSKVLTPAELVKALQSGSITIAQAQAMYNGVIPIGDNKGIAALYDIDKQVIQPLVWAEQQHILGLLDGRETGYDGLAITHGPAPADAAGTSRVGQLTVPDGEVWFVNKIEVVTPVGVSANWYCDLWPDRLGALGYGQAFYPVAIGPADDVEAEFNVIAPLWEPTNKQIALRLPGGTKLTLVTINTLAAVAAVVATLWVFGYVGKQLVV